MGKKSLLKEPKEEGGTSEHPLYAEAKLGTWHS